MHTELSKKNLILQKTAYAALCLQSLANSLGFSLPAKTDAFLVPSTNLEGDIKQGVLDAVSEVGTHFLKTGANKRSKGRAVLNSEEFTDRL